MTFSIKNLKQISSVSFTFKRVLGLKEAMVFCKLILCSEATSYFRKISLMVSHSTAIALANKTLSSAKKGWETIGLYQEIWISNKKPEFYACWRRQEKQFIHQE